MELKLAAPGSFRLFTEGVQALVSYERTSAADHLKAAVAFLTECVQKYPADLLPRFYLGIAQSLRGYDGLNAAAENLGYVINAGSKTLSLSARYNLAATYVEHHTDADLGRAERLLAGMLEDLDEKCDDDPLMFQAQVLLLYVQIDQHLSIPAKKGASFDNLGPRGAEFAERLVGFERKFSRSRSSKLEGANETWADYWNDRGVLHDALSRLARHDKARAQQDAQEALLAFRQALELKPNWPPVRANLAVVYSELLGDETSIARAEQILTDLALDSSEQYYANYKLGAIAERRKRWDEAIDYYRKAGWIPKAALAAARVLKIELDDPTGMSALLDNYAKAYAENAKKPEFVEAVRRLEAGH
jgi:tetratricopeptide (TPR) repeat protein